MIGDESSNAPRGRHDGLDAIGQENRYDQIFFLFFGVDLFDWGVAVPKVVHDLVVICSEVFGLGVVGLKKLPEVPIVFFLTLSRHDTGMIQHHKDVLIK